MTAQDWASIAQAIIGVAGAVIATLIGIFVPRAIAAFEKRTHIAVTEQERAAVLAAVTTAAGLLQSKLDVGLLRARDVTPTNSQVMMAANTALLAVPQAAAAQGTTIEAASAMIAARVDTTPRPTPVLAVMPPAIQKETPT